MVDSTPNPTTTLFERAACIRAVRQSEMNKFSRAIDALERIAEELQSPLAIVGGLAAIRHGAEVTTTDVDIVVRESALLKILDVAARHGMTIHKQSPSGWHQLRYHDRDGDVLIEILPAGGKAPRDPQHAPAVPDPAELGVDHGVEYASFSGWVVMKLVAARDKDRYHLGEVLKRASKQDIAQVVQSLRPLPEEYLREFQRLVQAAEDENADRW